LSLTWKFRDLAIGNFGNYMGNPLGTWEHDFKKFHPHARRIVMRPDSP
jgi:hypothetical protein